jgi:homoserine O-succinyltransferase
MPLIIEGRVPPRWLLEGNRRPGVPASSARLHIALINNMPDAALDDTELQFFNLLDDASGDVAVCPKLYSLPGIKRTERGQQHLNSFYYNLDELWQNQCDGVIITGTEPQHPNLRDEPYWGALSNVFDWAERNVPATILSCLAAHASVFHSDGIARYRLPDKQFGVFDVVKAGEHHLTSGTGGQVGFPHSRWNEVKVEELLACGYTVLTRSEEGGVDTFIKKKKQSLFLHFQGHPEYFAETLLKEYRRDIRRFLKKERETYPTMPKGYFNADGEKLATQYQELVLAHSREDLIEEFPDEELARALQRTWHSSATTIYRNWLRHILAQNEKVMSKVPSVAMIRQDVPRKRPAVR